MNALLKIVIAVVVATIACVILLRSMFKKSVFMRVGIVWFITLITVVITLGLRAAFFNDSRLAYVLFQLLNVVVCVGGFVYASMKVVRPLKRMVDRLTQLAKGDLDVDISDTTSLGKQNELVDISNATLMLRDNLRSIVQQLNDNIDNLSTTGSSVNGASEKLTDSATSQTASLEEISASMEQMVSNIDSNASSANESEKISSEVRAGMENVASRSRESLDAVHQIATQIGIVNDIAYQTNILALNAAVEAARAGEYGRGFAVVATEVRKLAERSREAADDIVNYTRTTVGITEQSAKQVEELIEKISQFTEIVSHISSAIHEEAQGAGQVNIALQQLNEHAQGTSSLVADLNEGVASIEAAGKNLGELIKFFKFSK